MVISDYLIDSSDIDWSKALATWSLLVPPKFTVWLANRFADLFLVLPDGTICMLDVGAGTVQQVAKSKDAFSAAIDDADTADEWLMIPLIDAMVAAGIGLQPGQCYGFKIPPVMGGTYSVENCGPLSICDYLGACGSIHEQLKDLPDGAEVVLTVINMPS